MEKFDKIAYNAKYNSKNYKQLKITLREADRDYIWRIADKYGLSNAELIKRAVKLFDETNDKTLSDSDK